MAPLLNAALEDTRALGSDREITATIKRCDDITLHGDRHRLRQLLIILCDNAVKYNSSHGTITLEFYAETEMGVLRIANTGPGIPATEQPYVFERFRRGAIAAASGVTGSGLGLSIAQWIVQAHGGSISVSTQPNHTEFTARLPRQKAPGA